MLTDIRYALRTLRRAPGFAATAVLCLAIGLAANTAAFSVLDAVVLRPIPFPSAERLVDVHETSATELCAGCGVGTSFEGFQEWQRDARAFDALAGYVERPMVLGTGVRVVGVGARQPAVRVQGAAVTPALLGMLGVGPVLGRGLVAADEAPGAERVVVLGHELWQRRFGGDSTIVGRVVAVNGAPATVVGVLAPRFRFPEFAELWMPLAPAEHEGGRANREIGVVGRLRPGLTAAAAASEMAALARAQERAHPESQTGWTATATPLRDDMSGDEAQFGWMLFGAVLLVQLVVCANVAGLVLARAAGRSGELALRSALGARRGRLARQVLVEVGLVAAAGGVLGFLAAADALALLARRAEGNIPYWIVLRADWRVAGFCLAVTVLTVLAVGGGVALRASRPNVQGALKGSGPTASAARRQGRTRAALVVGELAVTLVLLAGAGLLLKTSLRLMRPSEGADASRLVSADVALLDARWSDSSRAAAAAEQLAERVARVPGVEAAGASRFEFLAGFGHDDQPITIEGRATPAGASPRFAFAVTPGYWAARGVRVVSGRVPTAADGAGAEPVVVINASMAARLWPGASALGHRIKLGAASSARPWRTVVGVVADERPARGGDRVASAAWVPFAQWPGRPLSLTARVASAAQTPAVVRAIPGAAASVLPEEPVENVRTIADGARAVARPTWLIAGALGALAGFAVLVAALGVYGVVAQAVAQRTREIGVRVALGATSRDVLALLGRQSVRLATAGVVFGLAGAGATTRVIRGLLFGTDPLDLQVLGAVTALLALVTVVAGYLPARRATRIDPVTALRAE